MKGFQKLVKYAAIAFGLYLAISIIGALVGVIVGVTSGVEVLKGFSEDENVILKDVVLPELRGSSVADAKKVLKDLNIECTVEGDGDTITNMQPYPGYTIKKGSTINLYTDQNESYNKDVVMPDVRGYSKESAIELLNSLGIETTIQGDGVVINQSIPSGELISEGTVVKITLSAEYEED